jgi:hypothetical protein
MEVGDMRAKISRNLPALSGRTGMRAFHAHLRARRLTAELRIGQVWKRLRRQPDEQKRRQRAAHCAIAGISRRIDLHTHEVIYAEEALVESFDGSSRENSQISSNTSDFMGSSVNPR